MKYIVNGKIVAEGFVSVDDRGYTLGDGLFETIPLYNGTPFHLDYHFDRLLSGAKKINLALPVDQAGVADAISQLVEQNKVSRAVARLTITRGTGPRGYGSAGCNTPGWTLTCNAYEPMLRDKWESGFTLQTVSIRKDPQSPLRGLKTTSSLEAIMILDEARGHGADEALTLTTDGYISSGAACNIFWVSGGELMTPSPECAILSGVARRIIIDLAHREAMSVTQGKFYLSQLKNADEIFVTNSLIELVPVTKISGTFQSEGPGTITKKLAANYRLLI